MQGLIVDKKIKIGSCGSTLQYLSDIVVKTYVNEEVIEVVIGGGTRVLPFYTTDPDWGIKAASIALMWAYQYYHIVRIAYPLIYKPNAELFIGYVLHKETRNLAANLFVVWNAENETWDSQIVLTTLDVSLKFKSELGEYAWDQLNSSLHIDVWESVDIARNILTNNLEIMPEYVWKGTITYTDVQLVIQKFDY